MGDHSGRRKFARTKTTIEVGFLLLIRLRFTFFLPKLNFKPKFVRESIVTNYRAIIFRLMRADDAR